MVRLKPEKFKGVKINYRKVYVATNKGVKPYVVGEYYKDNKPVRFHGHTKKQVSSFIKNQLKVSMGKRLK